MARTGAKAKGKAALSVIRGKTGEVETPGQEAYLKDKEATEERIRKREAEKQNG